jgi:hypothetical protein
VNCSHEPCVEMSGISNYQSKTCLYSLDTRDDIKIDLNDMGYEEVNFFSLNYDSVQ